MKEKAKTYFFFRIDGTPAEFRCLFWKWLMKRQEQQRPQFKVGIICKIGLTVKVKVELNHEKWVFENTFESVKVKVNSFPIAFCYVFRAVGYCT